MCSFRFDFTSNGESEPLYKGTESKEQYRNMMNSFYNDVDDLEATLLMLQQRFKMKVVAIIGHSRGKRTIRCSDFFATSMKLVSVKLVKWNEW